MFNKIKDLCEKRGITIYKLEKDLGFSTGCISKWKSSYPSVDKAKAVAKYFDVTVEELMEGDEVNE